MLAPQAALAQYPSWEFTAARNGSDTCTISLACADYSRNGDCQAIGLGALDGCNTASEIPVCPLGTYVSGTLWYDITTDCFEDVVSGWEVCEFDGKVDLSIPCEHLDFEYMGASYLRCGPLVNPHAEPCGRNNICPELLWLDCTEEVPEADESTGDGGPSDSGCGCTLAGAGSEPPALLLAALLGLLALRRRS
jgi:MYXO-CTERM domain-containing protein